MSLFASPDVCLVRAFACALLLLAGPCRAWSQSKSNPPKGSPPKSSLPLVNPRMRVIIDNDFSGDPDGLFALVHLLLSPSVEVRGIIGSHLKVGDGFDPSATQADNAARKANEVLAVLNLRGRVPVVAGSNTGLPNDSTPVASAGTRLIVQEALRTDTKLPLYVLCGAGLTEIASAALLDPRIADRLTLVWIGGPEYDGLALPPPHGTALEYNLDIDVAAARVVFNRTRLPLWQVPRDAYRQVLLPYAQLRAQVQPRGPTGRYLAAALETLMHRLQQVPLNIGETYVLGDSPLVLLTALQSSFEADPSSSEYVLRPAPALTAAGSYAAGHGAAGRSIRVYRRLDTALLLNDFFAKLTLLSR